MDFKVVQKEIELQSRGWIPTFHDISIDVHKIVEESGIKNGTVSVVSHHTTCSVMIQECSHDFDSFDLEFLQHDLLPVVHFRAVVVRGGKSFLLHFALPFSAVAQSLHSILP